MQARRAATGATSSGPGSVGHPHSRSRMPLIHTEAIVLQAHAYSETSKILRLLTRTHGVQSVIAKGALRPRSRFGGILEPFSEGAATFYAKDGRDLHTLSGFDLTRSGQALGRDLIRFGSASLLAELVLKTASVEADPSLFDRVRAGLDRLERVPSGEVESAGLAEAWSLIGHLGFAPSLEACLTCERPLVSDEPVHFDYAAGGVHCTTCGAGGRGRQLPPHARQALLALVRGEAVPLDRTAAHWALLARFLSFHVVDGGALRSLTFLTETVGS